MTDNSAFNRISQQSFGSLSTGEQATLYSLKNANGMQVKITNYGGIIVAILAPDSTRQLADIVLGYDKVADYEADTYYLGAIIGRYAGRIYQGKATIFGQEFQLKLNAPNSQLHGGEQALNKQLWQAQTSEGSDSACLTLSYLSPDAEAGFPGNVQFKVNYRLNDNNELSVEYFASTDKPTLVNLTQHSYFNLAGHHSGDINQHRLRLNADYFLPMTPQAYPTGEIAAVANTPHDFTQGKTIGQDINSADQQITIGKGYDNYWLVNDEVLSGQTYAAQVLEPDSGRTLTLYTDQPSMVFYTANYIDGSHLGKQQCRYQARAAFCLEPQRANNKLTGVRLDNTLLTPEQPFFSRTRYVFGSIK